MIFVFASSLALNVFVITNAVKLSHMIQRHESIFCIKEKVIEV